MSDLYRGNAYAGDPSYDAFTGRVAYQTSSIVGMTPDGRHMVRRTCTYIDVGRAAPVTAADPDAVLNTTEDLPPEPRKVHKPLPAHMRPNPRRFQDAPNELQQRVVAYLRANGPQPAPVITHELGINEQTFRKHTSVREGYVYKRCGKRAQAFIWGLVGVHEGVQG